MWVQRGWWLTVEVEVVGCGRLVGFVGFTDDQVSEGTGRS